MIKILSSGLLTTLQDLGRYGYQGQGIPVSGAMDQMALKIGNALNGNDLNACGIEMTYSGFSCIFMKDTTIALTGADLGYTLNNSSVSMNETLYILEGDVLKATSVIKGVRGYLTVAGGFNVPLILNSASTYLKGKMGGLTGEMLKGQDQIPYGGGYLKEKRRLSNAILERLYHHKPLNVIVGTEEDYFVSPDQFFGSEYLLTAESDRMGFRLKGEKVLHKEGADILSAGLTFGSIQIPGNGQPIIMMADRQPTGGYSKIGQVVTLDHSSLAQVQVGQALSFRKISVEKAQEDLRAFNGVFKEWLKRQNTTLYEKGSSKRFKVAINSKVYNLKVEDYQ